MHRFIFHSNKVSFIIEIVILCYFLIGCGTQGHTEPTLLSKEGYLVSISDYATEEDTRWAKYLYDHLKKRAEDEDMIAFGVSEKDMFRIIVQIDPALKNDFKVETHANGIKLITSGPKKMLWLQYQIMKKIGDMDKRIESSDLPPALVNLNDTCGSFAFKYQSIYSPTGLHPDYPGITGLDNFDESWGIWGHNLGKVLGKDLDEFYATIDKKKYEEQLCFSSDAIYRRIENYIIDNYGEKKTTRFVIAPNDDPSACMCPACKALGNTSGNATPAVTQLITRLAKRFPHHLFFTTSYLSTRQVPAMELPSNVGVLISAIELPLRLVNKKHTQEKQFIQSLKQWKNVTKQIYVWDYINNFDDYLTPFPILRIARDRLAFFRENGVSGVFFNGSGYDYSSFDDIKTFALSALLINPKLSVEELIGKYTVQAYPRSQKLLTSYYCNLENRIQPGKRLHMYAGVQEAEKAFLPAAEFVKFYNELSTLTDEAKGDERKKLHMLRTALSFTRLELGRIHNFTPYGYACRKGEKIETIPETGDWLNRLNEHEAFPEMRYYNEASDGIDNYCEEWEQYIAQPMSSPNLLLGEKLTAGSKLDENYTDLSVLTDGTRGLPGSYHFGWFISSSGDLILNLPKKAADRTGKLCIRFLNLPRHRIYTPQSIELLKDGEFYKKFPRLPGNTGEKGEITESCLPVELKSNQQLTLRIKRADKKKAQIAIDEISFIPQK
ncbi:DUF4838 domain-containing protein [Bacteroides salyersiae]|uniref:DUF4838 domain-containing protein n=1 Tax=Bacteroides salyersiae TaxID=291644 RepID=UPI001C0268A8|nr:DUF4838 domain-containing protein [Bacteroides salyersiae]MBT9871239.1 DUF4838 domain-containing protein [Bacteroides salyersiae]